MEHSVTFSGASSWLHLRALKSCGLVVWKDRNGWETPINPHWGLCGCTSRCLLPPCSPCWVLAPLPGTVSSRHPLPIFPPHGLHILLQHFRRSEWHCAGRKWAPCVLGTAGPTLGHCLLKQMLGHLIPAFIQAQSIRASQAASSCLSHLTVRRRRQCWVYQGVGWHLVMQWTSPAVAGKGLVSELPDLSPSPMLITSWLPPCQITSSHLRRRKDPCT